MLLRPTELEAIRAGRIDRAFRRWDRPRLRAGTQMRTAIGLVEVTSVQQTTARAVTADDAHRAGATTRAELLRRLDQRNPGRPIFRIGLRYAGADPRIALRENATLTPRELEQIQARLQRLDRARDEPWTRATLRLIEHQPETKAAQLAAQTGRELITFKRDVRKLKELGLTESLERGYRLSPRGRAVLRATATANPNA